MAEQRLWAPWRLEYIRGAKSGECIFCAGAHPDDDRGRRIVHRGERCFVLLNAYPYASGHLMVAPFAHVPSIEQLEDEVLLELARLTRRSLAVLRELYRPDGFNIGINQGKVAGAGFDDHVHQHVVPRWAGDSNFMPVIGDTRVLPQSLDDSWREISEAFAT
ncbi:MAG: HIT domain-containing protein [Thermoleophilaceae bacterium]|nr:HIT domain-containing protein [Thermoleophilaceae bacterium]